MTWFEALTEFSETSPDQVRANLQFDETRLTSLVNNRSFHAGEFTTPTLETLRQVVQGPTAGDLIRVEELVAGVLNC